MPKNFYFDSETDTGWVVGLSWRWIVGGRTCLSHSQFGFPACKLHTSLSQQQAAAGFSKHEEEFLIYMEQIPEIFLLQTRSANDPNNDTVERQRLFCCVREGRRTYWPCCRFVALPPHSDTWAAWRLQKSPNNHVILVLLKNKGKEKTARILVCDY